jgi:hypothetical protein
MKTLMFAVNIDRAGGAPPSYRRHGALFLAPPPPVFPCRRGTGVYLNFCMDLYMLIFCHSYSDKKKMFLLYLSYF